MRNLIFSLFLLIPIQFSFGQKELKSARKTITSSRYETDANKAKNVTQNLKNTEKTVLEFIQNENSEARKAEAYYLISNIYKRLNTIENEKIYLKRTYDTLTYYSSIKNMYRYLYMCDSVAHIIKENPRLIHHYDSKVRKQLLKYRITLLNGCKYYLSNYNYALAYELSDMYLTSSKYNVLKGTKAEMTDSAYKEFAYKTLVAAYYAKNYDGVIKYAMDAIENGKNLPFLYEYIAESYLNKDEVGNWEIYAVKGLLKYPENPYFFRELWSFLIEKKRYSDIIRLCNDLLKKDPNNLVYLHAMMKPYAWMCDYEHCIEFATRVLNQEANNADANYYKGWSYCMLGNIGKKKMDGLKVEDFGYKKAKESVVACYKEACEPLELYKTLEPDKSTVWAPLLYNVYLYLNMGEKFSEIENLLNK